MNTFSNISGRLLLSFLKTRFNPVILVISKIGYGIPLSSIITILLIIIESTVKKGIVNKRVYIRDKCRVMREIPVIVIFGIKSISGDTIYNITKLLNGNMRHKTTDEI